MGLQEVQGPGIDIPAEDQETASTDVEVAPIRAHGQIPHPGQVIVAAEAGAIEVPLDQGPGTPLLPEDRQALIVQGQDVDEPIVRRDGDGEGKVETIQAVPAVLEKRLKAQHRGSLGEGRLRRRETEARQHQQKARFPGGRAPDHFSDLLQYSKDQKTQDSYSIRAEIPCRAPR